MAVGDIYRVQVNMQCGSQPTMNVLHIREQVARGGSEIGSLNALQMATDLYTALAAQMSEDWRVVSIRAGIVTPFVAEPPTVTIFGGAEAIVGAIPDELLPSNAPFVVTLYTSQVGRSGRGRSFLPGLPESAQVDGQMTNAVWSALQQIAGLQYQGQKGPFLGGTGEYRWNVFSAALGPAADSNVLQATVRPNLANMRSRRAFEGFAA